MASEGCQSDCVPANEFRAKVGAKQHYLMTVLADPKMFILGGDEALSEI